MARNELNVTKTYHPNGKLATKTRTYTMDCYPGKVYEHVTFYSTSGVAYNFVDRPVRK